MVTFEDPKGTVMEVFKRAEFRRRNIPTKGIVPHKLGHVAFFVKDVKKVTDFYCNVLGFRVSDWMGDFFSFLRCGVDHHTINLMQDPENRHFHTAFELRDWGHMLTACDTLSLNGYKLLWGPGRHGIGHNLFTYHRAPNGLITELFAQLDQMNEELGYFEPRPWHRDRPQKPKVWAKDPNAVELLGHHADRRNAQIARAATTKAARNDAPLKGGNDGEVVWECAARVRRGVHRRFARAVGRVRAERQSDQDRR